MLPDLVRLTNGGVSVVFAIDEAPGSGWPGSGLPVVVHWGRALSDAAIEALVPTAAPAVPHSSPDQPRSVSIVPTAAQGWSGTPGLALPGGANGLRLESVVWAGAEVTFVLAQEVAGEVAEGVAQEAAHELGAEMAREVGATGGVAVSLTYRLEPAGVLTATATVTNRAAKMGTALELAAARVLLPVPARAVESLDFTGRWSGERRPQRAPLRDGTHLRATRRGRPGHDSAFLGIVGAEGFANRRGEVWAVHIAWSGNAETIVERLPEGAGSLTTMLGGGELLDAGEVRLGPGESYVGPTVVFAWSDQGLDGLSERLHSYVRARAAHPRRPRPLTLNTWEAVYFDHDLDRLTSLAERAAAIGVERFILDDGWFRGRRHDRAGLGDWSVDPRAWPNGLGELADRVHGLGLEFGLWFEPEMVNPDSELARAHPEWMLSTTGAGGGGEWRHQHVLDVARDEAWDYLRASISTLVDTYHIDYVKWDHNRDLLGPAREQTLATYRLLAALGAAHPGLEIESCASGGGRVDLGILAHTHRVWASDTNDPVERQWIQRWTGLLLPPELIGAHVGPEQAHTTHRATSLSFRLATALYGHAGIEWDITACAADELATLTAWAALYRELRPLLHSGVSAHADDLPPGEALHGVVSPDANHAIFAWLRTQTTSAAHTSRVRFPGLRADATYDLRVRDEIGAASRHSRRDPSWFPATGASVTLPGELLVEVGVPLPLLDPAQAILLEVTRCSS